MYKGPMDKDNGVGVVFGSRVEQGKGQQWEEKWGQLLLNNNKNKERKKNTIFGLL